MKQSEIWDISFDPSVGTVQNGLCSGIIVSGNTMNNNYDLVMVCPLTSKIKNHRGNVIIEPSQTNGLSKKSEILVFHAKSISKKRLVRMRGEIQNQELKQIKSNILKILDY